MYDSEKNICQRKLGELARIALIFLGIPNTGCPVGNISFCYGEKDKIALTSSRKVLNFFRKNRIEIAARIKHNTVILGIVLKFY